MKILVLTNKLPFEQQTDFEKASKYFETRLPFPVVFSFKEVNIPIGIKVYTTRQGFNPTTGVPSLVNYYGLQDAVKDTCKQFATQDEYDCVFLSWNIDSISVPSDGVITSFTNFNPLYPKTEFVQLATNQYLKNQGNVWNHITHEIMHALCQPFTRLGQKIDEMDLTKAGQAFLKNDDPFAPDGNYALTLANLKPLLKVPNYVYFKDSEVVGLSPKLVKMLDEARGKAGIPFIINSGLRTAIHNVEVGGVEASSHLNGLAVDLRARTSNEHFLITKALFEVGFKRISRLYQNHIHVDIDEDKPQNILF